MRRFTLVRDGVRLGGVDWDGDGAAVLLLHGLAGHAGEWDATVPGLRAAHRVLALDARGHGASDRHPPDVSRRAHVSDVVAAIEHLRLRPVALVGQSLGGQTALAGAAARPDLVSRVVLIEAGPWGEQFDAAALAALGERLRAWPPDRRRHFDAAVMVRTMAAFDARDCWAEWERVRCLALLVLGSAGGFAPGEAEEMLARQPRARLAVVDGAAHDVHLDRPAELARVLRDFLSGAA